MLHIFSARHVGICSFKRDPRYILAPLSLDQWVYFYYSIPVNPFSVTGSNYMDCLTGTPCTRLLIFKIRQRCLSDISHSFCDDANKKKFNSRCVQWWANASVTCGNSGDMRDLNAFCLNMDSPLRTVYLIVPVILGQLWSYGRQC